MDYDIDKLRFCAYCPNPCRSAISDCIAYRESQTPSALALLTVLINDGHMNWDEDVRAALADTSIARKCKPGCPYGYDIAHEVESFTAAHKDTK